MTASLHETILKDCKPIFQKKYGDVYDDSYAWGPVTDKEFYNVMFKNFRTRKGVPYGLRLTSVGNSMLQRVYEGYSYHIKGDINHMVVVQLDQHMEWPYYVGRKVATFYNSNDAAWFRLNSNDLKLYTEHL